MGAMCLLHLVFYSFHLHHLPSQYKNTGEGKQNMDRWQAWEGIFAVCECKICCMQVPVFAAQVPLSLQ